MARLPYYENAVIDSSKVRGYILSLSHPIGRFEAAFFQKLGYSQENWKQLVDDIKQYHLPLNAKPAGSTKYGKKYEITGSIKVPSGKIMKLKSIWIVLKGEEIPRFITIYPGGKKHEI